MSRAIIYNASAGSGKTYTLAYNYVRDVVEQPLQYRKILAVTFTNKATEEMKRRILSEIHLLASGAESRYLDSLKSDLGFSTEKIRKAALEVRSNILHDYSRFTILTIDRFFQRIIRAFVQELGIDINYNIELDPSTLLSQSADRIIEQINANDSLKEWISKFVEERIEDGRSWDIREGILSLSSEIFKESNHSTLDPEQNHKQRSKEQLAAIVDKFTRLSEQSKESLKKLAQSALTIIAEASLTTESFHGKGRSFAKYFDTLAAGEFKAPSNTVRAKAESSEGWGNGVEAVSSRLQPILKECVDQYDKDVKVWNTAALLRENYRSFALLTDLYNTVKTISLEQNMMLLSETKLILSKFIAENHAPFIYEKVGNRFEKYMIDEFQDTSLKEWHNFLPLLENAMSQSPRNSALIVGDIKQSIYRWRGADWRILHSQARNDLGAENTEVINLQANYRSLANIVEFNNTLIEAVVTRDNNNLNEKLEAEASQPIQGELKNLLSDAYNNHQQIPRKGKSGQGYVSVTLHDQEPQIVERIKEILDQGFRPCEILILVRSNSEGVKVAGTLLDFKRDNRDSRYEFDVMTQEALTVGLAPSSQFIIAILKLSLNQADSIQRVIYNRFLDDRDLDSALSDEECEFLQSIRLLSTEEAFENIIMHYGLETQRGHIAYLQAIHESICNFCSSKSGDIAQFVQWWDEHGSQRSISVEQSEMSIEITTIHKAKGLEKAVVLIPYCTWALDPKSGGSGRVDPKKPQKSSAVWAEATESEGELNQIGAFPVKFKKSMGLSLFADQYYREYVWSHIDSVNMLYVALTRASQALHIFIKRGKIGIGRAITETLPEADGVIQFGDMEGVATTEGELRHLTFGVKQPPLERDEQRRSNLFVMDSYPTSQADLRLRFPSQRYFEQSEGEISTPRSEGIMMHKAFAEASSAADIAKKLNVMLLEGELSPEQHNSLVAKIEVALAREPIYEWFNGEWESVRNEHDIILPNVSNFKRPDRVMISGDRAVVVDYKFGVGESKSHIKQVAEYKQLLSEMGYKRVEGYVWYIKNDKIITV